MATLAKSLKTDMSATPVDSFDVSQPMTPKNYLQAKERIGEQKVTADVGLEKAKYDLDVAKQKATAQNAEKEALDLRTQRNQIDQQLEANPIPTFKPTQDDAMALGQLFSLVSTMGVMMGGSGKMASMNALGAMTGMLNGFKEGRDDLFKREKDTFDKEMNRVKAIHENIEKHWREYKELLATDREAADQKAMAIIAETGGSSIWKQALAKGRIDLGDQLVDANRKMQEKTEDHSFELSKMQKQFEQQKEMERYKAGLKQGVALPKEKELGQYRARFETIKNIEEIEGLLKDPEFRSLVNPATKLTPDFLQNLQENYPQLANKLARVQAIEFQLGGKALTATEQRILEPIYGWRGKTAEALENQLNETKRSLQFTQNTFEADYPGLMARKPMYEQVYNQLGTLSTLPQEQAEPKAPTEEDIAYVKAHPEKLDAFVREFGRQP